MCKWIIALMLMLGPGTMSAAEGVPEPVGGGDYAGLVMEGYVDALDYNQRLLTVSGRLFWVPIEAPVQTAFGGANSLSLLQQGQAVQMLYTEEQGQRVAKHIRELPVGSEPIEF